MNTWIYPSFIRNINGISFIIFEYFKTGRPKFPDTRVSKTAKATTIRVTNNATKYASNKARSGASIAWNGTKRLLNKAAASGTRKLQNIYYSTPTISFNRRSALAGGSRRKIRFYRK